MFHFTLSKSDIDKVMAGLKYALFVVAVCFATVADLRALTTCGPVTVNAPSAGVVLQQTIETETCNQINSKFQTGNLSSVMASMAKAYAVTSKGAVADYGTNMQVFSLGVGATVGVNNIVPTTDLTALKNRFSGSTVPDVGTGVGASATLGVSFRHINFKKRGWFDPKNINVYASFMTLPTLTYDIYSIKSTSASAYLQYKILPMRKTPLALVTWGGLDIGLGYTYATSTISASSASKITSIDFTTNGATVNYQPAGTLSLAYTSHVMPLEVSTNFSLLYFLSFVVGGAADFHLLSSATIAASITGPVTVNGVTSANDYASFALSETGKAATVGFRAFFGPQFNIWKIRIFTLAHITNDTSYAMTVGARFSW